ncbi:gephyrin-like molybdotransferase Glp [Roseomonas sp. BN140053]|uniref:molybdopterin molybdotransferase MoeA n=1 Tax=Roseomonas sp. BN140053 TaxID=3391898 RepID=UPI0039EAD0C9
MAQLTDDCFAFGGPLLGVEAAAALIAERVPPLAGEERLPLLDARGRVLARNVIAPRPLPGFFNSAVDGFAFRHAELRAEGETRLRLAGRVAAGAEAPPLDKGQAMRVLTGAPMPEGADTVIMQEDAAAEDGFVFLRPGLRCGANCRPAGEDVPRGGLALRGGSRIGPAEIGLAAALGLSGLPVTPRPRVGVFSTGNELVSPGRAIGGPRAYDSNRYTLLSLLAGLPAEARDLGILRDAPAAMAAALADAAGAHDLLLCSGGVSTGEEDHVRAAIESGGSLVFWRLAVKPGRPAAMGVVGGTPVLGLPGNPVAAVVTFLHLARPLILRLAGATPAPLPRFTAVAEFSYRKKAGRREYVRVSLHPTAAGAPIARKFPREGAGLLSSLTESDAFAELDENSEGVEPGEVVRVLPFAAVF